MATFKVMGPLGLLQHRRWEDIASMILGAAIIISPLWLGITETPTVMLVTALVGAAVVVLASLEVVFLRRWEEILALACGLWLTIQPFVFAYDPPLRNWHIVLGALVAILAILELWQDRNRDMSA